MKRESGLNENDSPQAKAQQRIDQLKRDGKLPTLDQWLAVVAKARVKYQHQVLAAREKGRSRKRSPANSKSKNAHSLPGCDLACSGGFTNGRVLCAGSLIPFSRS